MTQVCCKILPTLAAQLPAYLVPGLSILYVFYRGQGTVSPFLGNWAVRASWRETPASELFGHMS